MVNLNLLPPWMKHNVKGFRRALSDRGAGSVVLSTRRSAGEQAELCRNVPPGRPCAKPGCSQHQYGFAVDMTTNVWYDSLRDAPCTLGCVPVLIHRGVGEWLECGKKCVAVQRAAVRSLASEWYLQQPLPVRDPNHYQAYPTAHFTSWLRAHGVNC